MLTKAELLINGEPAGKYIDKLKKSISTGKKQNLKVRNDVLRLFSDFISTRGPFKDASGSSAFSKPSAAPDMRGSLKSFKDYFGIDVAPSTVGGNVQAYAEIKQRISRSTSTTITSLQLRGTDLSSFESMFGITATTKQDTGKQTYTGTSVAGLKSQQLVEYIKTIPELRNSIIDQASQKFQNTVYINYLDKRHNNKPTVSILKDASTQLDLRNIDSKYLTITARVIALANSPTIKLQITLSKEGEQKLKNDSIDVSVKFHESLGTNIVGRFANYAIQNRLGSVSDFGDYVRECITLANEFAEGSHTPIEYVTELPSINKGSISQTVNLIGQDTQKAPGTPTQAFISSAQWTKLVQERLGNTMLKQGIPNPPDLKERSGEFRRSVQVSANYRANLLQYTYNPWLDSLRAYGYRPDLQVQQATREVAQQLYGRQFNIIRGL